MQPELQVEHELIENAKRDPKAFGGLYELHYSKIFNYVLTRTADVQSAQDITSNIFFKALENIQKYNWRGIPFSAWLYQIANNETANHFRRLQKGQIMDDSEIALYVENSESAEEELIQAQEELKRHEQYLSLHKSIVKLDNKYQEVITLRYFQNKPLNEIAIILGKSEGTVKSLLHRGLRKLRTLIE